MRWEYCGMIKVYKIKWPTKKPIISSKDKKNINLKIT